MTGDDSPLLQGAQSDSAEPLVRAMFRARELEPNPKRLNRVHERLLAAVDAMSSSSSAGLSPSVTAGASWKGLTVVGLALALLQAPAPRQTIPDPAAPLPERSPVISHTTSSAIDPHSLSATSVEYAGDLRLHESTPRSAAEHATDPKRREEPRKLRSAEAPSELELLRAAQRALPESPSTALARLAEHRAIYPHGLLEQERQVLQIQSLLASQRARQARDAAAAFAIDFPRSAHLRRIQRMLEDCETIESSLGIRKRLGHSPSESQPGDLNE